MQLPIFVQMQMHLLTIKDCSKLWGACGALRLTKLRFAAGLDQSSVFALEKDPNAGRPISRGNTWRDFDVIRRRAGLPPCSLHDLRRR